jgi:hypothetical protein
MLYGGAPTDRFDAQQARGYLYIVFNDHNDHTFRFRVWNSETGGVYITSSRMEVMGTVRPGDWHGIYAWFQIAGRLRPGSYLLELAVDDRPAGTYPFSVISETPQR